MNKHHPKLSAVADKVTQLQTRRYDYTLLRELGDAARALDVAALRAGAMPGYPDALHQSRLADAEAAVDRAIARLRKALGHEA